MRLIVTGGGTGGHIYPALEVARFAETQGAEILYLGSLRGQEGKICEARGVLFQGFPSEPLYSMKTPRGWRGIVKLLQARSMAKTALKVAKADAVFSTGGYSAGPVVSAARALKIPYFIHAADSVPARSSLWYAKEASAFTTLFKSSERFAPEAKCQRVGQPIRKELRDAAAGRNPDADLVLCVGGSQGSEFLNGCVPRAFAGSTLANARLLIASGPKNFETTSRMVTELGISHRVIVKPFLETQEMLDAYQRASVVIARSGSTLAEFALFGIPSVLVPLPTSASNHQLHNAEEFAEMHAATLLPQSDATPNAVAEAVSGWLNDESKRETAKKTLRAWDLPNATESIWNLIAGGSR